MERHPKSPVSRCSNYTLPQCVLSLKQLITHFPHLTSAFDNALYYYWQPAQAKIVWFSSSEIRCFYKNLCIPKVKIKKNPPGGGPPPPSNLPEINRKQITRCSPGMPFPLGNSLTTHPPKTRGEMRARTRQSLSAADRLRDPAKRDPAKKGSR